ncbi:serine hydrolase [Streptomyces sp. NPDC049555]|uniref:D-alanyl-D-alanine carboxypeptidase family protein n=1 Tax=unclassified Streptomyces TaxID=2593676 RepID=UPI00343816E4
MQRCGGIAVQRLRRLAVALTASTAAVTAALPAAGARAAGEPPPPTVGAKGAYLADGDQPLFGKAADVRRPMASTTKVMTAVVVVDEHVADLDREVTVKQVYRDWVRDQQASTADLRTGDRLTVRQLLYALMLPSGCDAAYALADTFGSGATEKERTASFVADMNKKAQELGLADTHYDSFDGNSGPAGNNWTSPHDLAVLAAHALSSDTFATVVRAMSTRQRAQNVNRLYTWYNTNKLLGSYDGVIGIKTGSTRAAGPCLVFAARRGEHTVIGAVLAAQGDRYRDAAKMLDYAFRTTTRMTLRHLPAGAHED